LGRSKPSPRASAATRHRRGARHAEAVFLPAQDGNAFFTLKRAVEPSTLFGFRVSRFLVSWFHPNRDRGRDRYRDRSFNHGTLSLVSWFHGFRVSSKSLSLSGSLSESYTFSCTLTRDPRHSTRDVCLLARRRFRGNRPTDGRGCPHSRHRRSRVASRGSTGGTSVCSSGRRFTPPPLKAQRRTQNVEVKNSLPINCQDARIFRIEQHHVNHGYMRPGSGKSCPVNCQDYRIFRIEQHHVNHGYMRPRSGKSCPIN